MASAGRAVLRCVVASAVLLLHQPIPAAQAAHGAKVALRRWHHRGGLPGTVVAGEPIDPCTLLVTLWLRGPRGGAYAAFRAENLLNTDRSRDPGIGRGAENGTACAAAAGVSPSQSQIPPNRSGTRLPPKDWLLATTLGRPHDQHRNSPMLGTSMGWHSRLWCP